MPKQKLTRSFVAKAICPPGQKREFITDTDTRGLVLEVRASGGRTFYLRYSDRHGDQRNIKLGEPGSVRLWHVALSAHGAGLQTGLGAPGGLFSTRKG